MVRPKCSLSPFVSLPARLGAVVFLATILAVALPATGWTWGSVAHHYIAQHYSQHLPATIDGLRSFDSVVDSHVMDPDNRKSSTPGESVKHYIDIDWYPEFLAGTITHDRATLEAEYGASTVSSNGVLPWAVGDVVAVLTQQFQAGQWSDAALTIADLCHYVGDSCQPLHCTVNYNGYDTGNGGIHSRYESTMMGQHIGDLNTPQMPVTYYPNPVDAMFDIITTSWGSVAAIMQADDDAKVASGGSTTSSTYYAALWAGTETFTRERVNAATVATASFVYTAWVDAGEPPVPGSTADVGPTLAAGINLSAGPTPFGDALAIRYSGPGPLSLDVYDVRGARVAHLVDRASGAGSVSWRPASGVGPGVYFLRLSGPQVNVVRRITHLQ